MTLRLLKPGDARAALELSTAAGWNQTEDDWRRLIALEPAGCFGIEVDGELAATTTLLCYGVNLAWVGMVLTDPGHQRRGYARKLVSAALDEAQARGMRCIKLDATGEGRPLYESLGFVAEQPIERWHTSGATPGDVPEARAAIPMELDRKAFGADRARLLGALGPPVLAEPAGYVITRPGMQARYLGPCVAKTAEAARRLIAAALSTGPMYWDLLPGNPAARDLATHFGFTCARRLVRMQTGTPIPHRDEWVFSIAGFEAG